MSGSVPGRWALTMRTPIGSIDAELVFALVDGVLTGTASGAEETGPLHDVRIEPVAAGERVTWTQSIAKPLRLNLAFDVVVDGTSMHGHSRAGRLPRSGVSGRRIGD